MDANTVTVSIAGREFEMARPSGAQIMGLQMMTSNQLSETSKLNIMMEMFLRLLPDDEARTWAATQFAINNASPDEFVLTLKALITAPSDGGDKPAVKPVKKTAKRAVKRAA